MVEFNLQQKPADLTQINTHALIGKFFEFKEKIDIMADEAKAVEVVDQASMIKASEMTAQVKKIRNAMSKRRAEVTRPLLDAKKSIDGAVARLDQALHAISRGLDAKTIPYMRRMEEERLRKAREAEEATRKALRKAEEAEEAARIEAAAKAKKEAEELGYTDRDKAASVADAVAAVVPVAPQVPAASVDDRTKVQTDSGSSTLDYEYSGELVDIRQLPVEGIKARFTQIKSAVQPWINAQIKFGSRTIPGVKITRKEVIKRRVR